MKNTTWQRAKKILCIRPDNMGDVLMTTPAFQLLKDHGKHVCLLASSAGSSIAEFIPCIDQVITFNPPWQGNHEGNNEMISELISTLKSEQFDAAIIFTVYSQNPLPAAMICYQASIPLVAGYCRENPYGLMTDWIPDREPLYEIKHEVTRQVSLLNAVGFSGSNDHLVLSIPEDQDDSLFKKLDAVGVDRTKPWLLMHPGVSEQRRQYPPEDFARVASDIVRDLGFQILLTGTSEEKNLADYIRSIAGDHIISVAGELEIGELISLVSKSPLLISNNTGPVHIAAAVKTPVIVTYALTNPQHTPWKVKHIVLPFDVSEDQRSRNTIIAFSYDKLGGKVPSRVTPEAVFKAVRHILYEKDVPEETALIS